MKNGNEAVCEGLKFIGNQTSINNPLIVAKYVKGPKTWYVTDYMPEKQMFYGLIDSGNKAGKWGLFKIHKKGFVRDMTFRQQRLSKIKPDAVKYFGQESKQLA